MILYFKKVLTTAHCLNRHVGIKVQAGGIHLDYESWQMTGLFYRHIVIDHMIWIYDPMGTVFRLSWTYSNANCRWYSYPPEVSTIQWGAYFWHSNNFTFWTVCIYGLCSPSLSGWSIWKGKLENLNYSKMLHLRCIKYVT